MKINGHEVEAGCLIDGHWGQYAIDRMADIAEDLGAYETDLGVCVDDPRWWRSWTTRHAELGMLERINYDWDQHAEAGERVERWLNDHAEGCRVEWVDGECFIVSDDELGDLYE